MIVRDFGFDGGFVSLGRLALNVVLSFGILGSFLITPEVLKLT